MKQFIIIGNSAAGIAAVEAIRKRDTQSKITVIADEGHAAYCRCLISYYLAGEVKEEKIILRPEEFYKENNIELFLNKKVDRVDPKKGKVVCEDKTQFPFDALLVATGARPKFPEIKGIKRTGVFGFRTIKDAQEITALLPLTKTVCVLGGGLVGLKAAYALRKKKVEVKVIVKSRQVLSQMLDFDAAGFVQRKLEEHGIELVLGQDVVEVIGEGDIRAVKLDSGKAIGCSMIIVGKGVNPNTGLIEDTQIRRNEGIIANEFLQTSAPTVYVAGDVCESFDVTLGTHSVNALWPVAVEQGKLAGANMAGDTLTYDGSLGMNSLEFFGLPVISLGVYKVKDNDPSFEVLTLTDAKAGVYKKVVLKNNIIVGAILVGDIGQSGVFLTLMRQRLDVSSFKDVLFERSFGYPTIRDLVKDTEKIYI